MEMLGATGAMLVASGTVLAVVAVVAIVGHVIERARHRDEPPLVDPNRQTNAR
ncbi:hypothetical protein [Methylobacterium isbiliense]|uniref:Uncharacterized protein n=1 Tax=Methylobacterium isbiliense TaxID=315478 RepID=A0ABQ4SS90_9HYPH|nr:hypothetical protein [Methylobacterium isbiliense]MDN3627979.1 hypothetical protein [Methylobacterium isbiliense]GJE04536.1 hypothetical protein GMJLKIPL_6500 [Methylobacterium isbiliense]